MVKKSLAHTVGRRLNISRNSRCSIGVSGRLKRGEKSLLSQIKDAENILAAAQKQRASEVDRSIDLGEAFLGERTTLFESIEELSNDRDLIIAEAAQTKKETLSSKDEGQSPSRGRRSS